MLEVSLSIGMTDRHINLHVLADPAKIGQLDFAGQCDGHYSHSIGLYPGCGGSALYDIKLLTGTLNRKTNKQKSSILH